MHVKKHDGTHEPIHLDKILVRIQRACEGLPDVDALLIAKKTIDAVHDGVTTRELDEISVAACAALMAEEPNYSKVAARVLASMIAKEAGRDATLFQVAERLYAQGSLAKVQYTFIKKNRRALEAIIDHDRDDNFEYFGLNTFYSAYLIKDEVSGKVIERPQHVFARVAIALAKDLDEIMAFYDLLSNFDFMSATPTLFNAGTAHPQCSSCYLQTVQEDSLEGIYKAYTESAQLSKWAGGLGISWGKVRAAGSPIKSTKGKSSGTIPFIKTLDSSVKAVNQAGKRRGACAVYLPTAHPDLMDFLELRDNTGSPDQRAYNLNLANWIPDLFMRRVEANETWSFFCPSVVPELYRSWGDDYDRVYAEAEAKGLAHSQLPAQQVYARMMKTLGETGQGWMCFADHVNRNHPQVQLTGTPVDSSNLCTEILEVRERVLVSDWGKQARTVDEVAVCNLGSVNLARHITPAGTIDEDKLRHTVTTGTIMLDRVIDVNFYPVEGARMQNMRWRNIGLGCMGFHEALYKMRLPFESEQALAASNEFARIIWEQASATSKAIADVAGSYHPSSDRRNSLLIAIAPTATIASITGTTEAIEPSVSNLFRREVLSGEYLQINKYLVQDLKDLGLWSQEMLQKLKDADGSVQGIAGLPEATKALYKTAWEMSMRSLVDLAAERYPFIDQAQSLNLFMERPTIGKLSSMYRYAWQRGLKTTYYLRSRAASKTTSVPTGFTDSAKSAEDAVSCSLENPETCQSCQ